MSLEDGNIIECPNCKQHLVYRAYTGGSFCPHCSYPIVPEALPQAQPKIQNAKIVQHEEGEDDSQQFTGAKILEGIYTQFKKFPLFFQLMLIGFLLALAGMTIGGWFGGMIQTVLAGGGVILIIVGFMQMDKWRKEKQ